MEQTVVVDKSVFCCSNPACGWPLGVIIKAGNVSVLRLEGLSFVVAIRKSENVQCKACGRVTRWHRSPEDR